MTLRQEGLRRYTRADYELMSSWYTLWGMETPPPSKLSSCGWVLNGVAMGFIYPTEGSIALIDGLVASPALSKGARHAVVKRLAGSLVDIATALGYSTVIAVTTKPSVQKLCEELGFKEIKGKMYCLSESILEVEEEMKEAIEV